MLEFKIAMTNEERIYFKKLAHPILSLSSSSESGNNNTQNKYVDKPIKIHQMQQEYVAAENLTHENLPIER